jgi:hypothetical protein
MQTGALLPTGQDCEVAFMPVATVTLPTGSAPELIDLVDFKWLMATEGHRVDLDRLQADRAYARGCIALAAGSGSQWLRQAAQRLLRPGGKD